MGGELSLRRISPIRPRRWEDTLDKRALKDQMRHRLGISDATGRPALWGQ